MRGWLLLVTAAACAQDNRGFVNQRLVTQDFVKNSLKPRTAPTLFAPKAPATTATPQMPLKLRVSPPAGACAIPLLEVPIPKNPDPTIAIQPRKPTGDDRMILPTIPVCGKR